jgi:hypothetical protein
MPSADLPQDAPAEEDPYHDGRIPGLIDDTN